MTIRWYKGMVIGIDDDSDKDWRLDLRELGWLAAGENIALHTVTPGTGITIHSDSHDNDGVTFWVRPDDGLNADVDVAVFAQSDNTPPRKDEWTITFRVRPQ